MRKILVIVFLLSFLLPFRSMAQTISDYTAYPLFMAQTVAPNILIILDNSGSMNFQAYTGAYDHNTKYYGYFEPYKKYTYSSNQFVRDTGGNWDGNFLNWLAMRRIDVARKVLMGGKATSRTGGGNQTNIGEDPAQSGRDFTKVYNDTDGVTPFSAGTNYSYVVDDGNFYVDGSTYIIRVKKDITLSDEASSFVDGNIAGVLQKIGSKARWGNEFFNYGTGNNGSGGYIASTIGTNMTSLITDLENTGCDTWTPLAEAYYVAMQYFKQEEVQSGLDYPNNAVPCANVGDDPYYNGSDFVYCAKSFVILLTDGASTMDMMIPDFLKDYDSDGNDPGSYSDSGSDYLDDIALYARTNDLRDLAGDQNLILYTIYAFGNDPDAQDLLKDAAKNGGFEDRDGNKTPNLQAEWDADEDGIPDTYFEASDGYQLEERLLAAVTDILRRAASGTAVSVLATSAEGEGTLFQAFFRPTVFEGIRQINWVGYLQALWVDPKGNIREDSNGDYHLDLTQDKIIKFVFDETTYDTTVKRYSDSDGDGELDTLIDNVPLDEIKPLWEAGKLLAMRDPDQRVIYTFVDEDKDGKVGAGEFIQLTSGNAGTLRPYLRATDSAEATNIIGFLRGEEISGFRDRNLEVESVDRVWKLGDIVHSTPTVVGSPMDNYDLIYGDESYSEYFQNQKSRDVMVYLGSNDGMLHAFKAGTFYGGDDPRYEGTNLGSELWAYIPYNLLPHLKWLTDTEYTHVYYVDLKPKAVDVKLGTGWRTILIVGMRLGGGEIQVTDDFGSGAETRTFRSAYFAMDVTSPENPELLWEFTHPNLAFTTSYPAIVKISDEWFMIVGSGPTEYSGESSQNAHLLVIDINTGNLRADLTCSENNAFLASPISIDANLNYNVDICYVGETYKQGTSWKGKVYRLSTKSGGSYADPTAWTLSTLFDAGQPITSAPGASLDSDGNFWVYFGTGRYFNDDDKVDTTTQSFYGTKDACFDGSCTTSLVKSDLFDATSVSVSEDGSVAGVSGVTTWDELLAKLENYKGWYTDLSGSGERVITNPSILGGMVLFTTFIPNSDICGFGGSGNFYALYFETGSAYTADVIGTEAGEVLKKNDLGYGIPSSLGIHVGKEEGGTGYVQQSTAAIQEIDIDPALKIKSGVLFWREK